MLRLSSGKYKGFPLKTPSGREYRPTSGKIREALVCSAEQKIRDQNVLDLCAGSGAVGLECISRGAASAYFIENNRLSYKDLSTNIRSIYQRERDSNPQIKAIQADIAKPESIKLPDYFFSLIFIDPPYEVAREIIPTVTAKLKKAIAKDGWLVIESRACDQEFFAAISGWSCFKQKQYGDTVLSYLHADN